MNAGDSGLAGWSWVVGATKFLWSDGLTDTRHAEPS